jgi:hypothetical protein
MTISTPFTFTAQTISTTEIDLTSNTSSIASNTTDGIYQLFLDLNAMTATESYRLRIKEKATPSSSQRNVQEVFFTGAQTDEPIYVTPALLLGEGWTFTFTKMQGTDRAFSWSIRAVT